MTTTQVPNPNPQHLRPGALRPDLEHSDKIMPIANLEEDALALRTAWGIYLLMGALPPLVLILGIFYLIFTGDSGLFGPTVVEERTNAGWAWFLAGMAWIGLSMPVVFYIRRQYWAEYYAGGLVGPADYIKGCLAIWTPMVIGGIMGIVGFAATYYVASLFTSVLAFLIFMIFFPNGHAMTRPIGDHDDPGVYEEPR